MELESGNIWKVEAGANVNVLIRKISKQVDEGISSSIYACIYVYIYSRYVASDCICSRNEDSYMSYTTIHIYSISCAGVPHIVKCKCGYYQVPQA